MKVLIAVDGSKDSLAAVQRALQLLHGGLRASFVLANVQAPASLYEVVVAHDAQVIEDVRSAAAVETLAGAEALMRAAGAAFESEAIVGDPGHGLLEICARFECELIVIGAQESGSGSRVGSVANAVLHAAEVPVMVVRGVA